MTYLTNEDTPYLKMMSQRQRSANATPVSTVMIYNYSYDLYKQRYHRHIHSVTFDV